VEDNEREKKERESKGCRDLSSSLWVQNQRRSVGRIIDAKPQKELNSWRRTARHGNLSGL